MNYTTKPNLCCLTLMFAVICLLTNNIFSQLKIIDAHTHGINFKTANWKELGVIGGVNMPVSGGKNNYDPAKNAVNCYAVIYESNGDGIVRTTSTIENDIRGKNYKCLKIFLGYHFKGFASDSRLKPIYDLAKDKNLTVVFHTGDPFDNKGLVKYAHPLYINEVAASYPNVDFVLAHCGNPWIQDAALVANNNNNVFLECSALAIDDDDGNLSQTKLKSLLVEPVKWMFNYLKNPRKMMYGSDYHLVQGDNLKPYLKSYMDAIPKEDWQKVFYENAVCIYKFSEDFQRKNKMPVDCNKWRAELIIKK